MTYSMRQAQKPRPWRIHPIWRGLGCVMIVLIPVIAFAISSLLVDYVTPVRALLDRVGILRAPVDLMGWTRYILIYIPEITSQVQGFVNALGLKPVEYWWGKVMITMIISMILFAILSIIYSIIFTATGPGRYGPLDVPGKSYKKKKKLKKIKY